MSRTTMYVFQGPDWNAKSHGEWRNSWGSAAFVWEKLVERYQTKIRGIRFSPGCRVSTISDNWAKLWEQEKDIPYEPWERNVLRATYDRAIVRGLTPLARIAGDLRRFEHEYHRPGAGDGVCHLASIGLAIERLLRDMGRVWVPTAIGFQHTSVAEDLWRMPEGEDETRPYNLERDKLHHELELTPSIWD